MFAFCRRGGPSLRWPTSANVQKTHNTTGLSCCVVGFLDVINTCGSPYVASLHHGRQHASRGLQLDGWNRFVAVPWTTRCMGMMGQHERLGGRYWNQLPAPLRQPRTNLSNSASPSCMSGTSSIGSIVSPLLSSITPSLFHSRLKTFLFCKFFPP